MGTSRSLRRHHAKRLFAKRWHQAQRWIFHDTDPSVRIRYAQLGVHTTKRCSCHFCYSSRKLYGNAKYARTFQELRFLQRWNDIE